MAVKTQNGFSLIEMMVALVISSFILMAAYSAHIAQQGTYFAQDQVAEMQQIHRAALAMINLDLRMAGYDPQGSGNFGITSALAGRVQFTADTNENGTYEAAGNVDTTDIDDDGDTTETLHETYDLGFSTTVDSTGDGIPDQITGGVPDASNLGKQVAGAGGFQNFAENIQAVEFTYMEEDGTVTATLADIRVIQVTVLARAGKKDTGFTNGTVYTTPGGQSWGPYNDNYRRRLLTTSIRCRNLGL